MVRRTDLEPYRALRWVAVLFKAAAVFLLVALFTEIVVGVQIDGLAALPVLLGETARTFVLTLILWGGGDLARLLVHIGHDVRAQRVLQSRMLGRGADARLHAAAERDGARRGFSAVGSGLPRHSGSTADDERDRDGNREAA